MTSTAVSPSAPLPGADSTAGKGNKLLGLQVLRFVAALAIVLFHVGSGLQIRWGHETNIFAFGAAGVDVFFVISGFIIAYTTDPAQGARAFCRRRLVRIVPLYWLLTFGVVAIALIRPGLLNSTEVDLASLLKSLFFIPFEKSNGMIQPILFLGWTLNYEMFFYAVYAGFLALGARSPLGPVVFITLLVAAGQMIRSDNVLWRFYTSPIVLEFVFGIALYLVHARFPGLFRRGSLPILAVFAGSLVLRQMMPALPWVVANGIPAALLVAAALPWAPRASRLVLFLVLLGDASYSLYLVHPYVIQAFIRVLPQDAAPAAQIVVCVVAGLVSILIAILLFRWFEKPVQQALNAWFAKRSGHAGP